MATAGRSAMIGLAAAAALLVGAGAPALAHGGDDDDDRVEREDRVDRDDRGGGGDRGRDESRDSRDDGDRSRDDRGGDDRTRDGVNRNRVRADGRREIRRAGRCTTSTSRVKLKVKNEDRSRLEVEFEVDQNRGGDRWGTIITRNGRNVLRRSFVTRPPSGSFEARRMLRDTSGRDIVVGTARNMRTGERCSARIAF